MKLRLSFLLTAVSLVLISILPALAQTLPVSGTVVSQANNERLAGATVTVKGTSVATITDENGHFSITLPEGNRTLVITFSGMTPQEITVTGTDPVTVSLSPLAASMSEVVVIGYGTQRRAAVTGAISSVRADELNTVSTGRIDQALQGRTAGVNIVPSSGAPGSGMSIRIRGTGSNGNSNPLYIVDGVRTGGIDTLDPSEIATIDALKDAASAAIYGSAAANGVILITT
ncbi:MAG: carboxypeptidase-like regulatory domain-containing protein, partial [Flavisolibacter sp.]